MSVFAACLSLSLGAVPPPPPPEAEEAAPAEAPLETLGEAPPEAPPGDAEAPSGDDGSATVKSDTEPPKVAPGADINYDRFGDPIVPYGDRDRSQEELPFAEDGVAEPELAFAETVTEPGEELSVSDTPPRSTPSRAALERQAAVDLDAPDPGAGASKQRFAVELKFGPYVPSVDDATNNAGLGPYATIFGQTDANGVADGQPKAGLYSVLSFEWQFANFAGPLSIGTQVGFFRDRAAALLAEPETENVRSDADTVTFLVVPVAVLIGYRFEWLADKHRVPLVPYARGGIAYGLWWSKDGSGEVSENDAGEPGRGGSIGWQTNFGMMLRMDFIDRGSAGALDRATGINHTYLFGEYQISRLNGFGTGNRMSVGDDTFLAGLAVEF